MNKEEILANYTQEHNNFSKPYYENKKAKSKALGLYLTPETLVETIKRQVLKKLPAQAQEAVRQAFENGNLRGLRVVREYTLNNPKDLKPDCLYPDGKTPKPAYRFSELTPAQKDDVWQMILDENEFIYEHQNIWYQCDVELLARKDELKAKPILSMDEEQEKQELSSMFPEGEGKEAGE